MFPLFIMQEDAFLAEYIITIALLTGATLLILILSEDHSTAKLFERFSTAALAAPE